MHLLPCDVVIVEVVSCVYIWEFTVDGDDLRVAYCFGFALHFTLVSLSYCGLFFKAENYGLLDSRNMCGTNILLFSWFTMFQFNYRFIPNKKKIDLINFSPNPMEYTNTLYFYAYLTWLLWLCSPIVQHAPILCVWLDLAFEWYSLFVSFLNNEQSSFVARVRFVFLTAIVIRAFLCFCNKCLLKFLVCSPANSYICSAIFSSVT